MSDNDYPNSGSLFKNDKKMTDKQKDMYGSIVINEELLEVLLAQRRAGQPLKLDLAAWTRTTRRDGSKFLSLAVSKPWERDGEMAKPKPKPASSFDDDLPF